MYMIDASTMYTLIMCIVWVHKCHAVCFFFWYTDQLHLEIKVMYQGIRLSNVEEDMKVIVVQQELIMNKLSNIERYMYLSNQFSCFQPP